MVPVSRRHVVISLPDARPMWQYRFHVPNVFDGKHCWVIKKQGYDLARSSNLGRLCPLVKNYRVLEKTSHRFFVSERH